MSILKVYGRIEDVLREWGHPAAAHEFSEIEMDVDANRFPMSGRIYVGCTEATIGRRMREMTAMGRLTAKTREGKTFKEYSLPVRKLVQAEFSLNQVEA